MLIWGLPQIIRRRKVLTAFTLLELMVVVIILGIIVSAGMPTYKKAMERVRCSEAVSHLKIIRAKQQVLRMEINKYLPCSDTADCNTKLDLDLPLDNWDYVVRYIDGVDTTFNATANRLSGTWSSCEYRINGTMNRTANNANCIYTE